MNIVYTVVERIVNKLVCIAQGLYIHIRKTIKLCIFNANEERVYSFRLVVAPGDNRGQVKFHS